jgi:uncharacterized repeat protein (TIGR02543 family)
LNPAQPADGYAAGMVVTVTATASNNYNFTGWSDDLSGTTNPATVTMNSAKTITANFAAISVTPNYWLWGGLALIVILVIVILYFLVLKRYL